MQIKHMGDYAILNRRLASLFAKRKGLVCPECNQPVLIGQEYGLSSSPHNGQQIHHKECLERTYIDREEITA